MQCPVSQVYPIAVHFQYHHTVRVWIRERTAISLFIRKKFEINVYTMPLNLKCLFLMFPGKAVIINYS